MKLRVRLILAFLLLSVVPLGAVTIYSYVSNYKALEDAATGETDQMAEELIQRMQIVTTQLSDRVEHLMDISTAKEPAASTAQTKNVEAPPAVEPSASAVTDQAAATLGEAAMLLNTVELRGMRGPGGGRGRGGPPRPGPPGTGPDGRRDGRPTEFAAAVPTPPVPPVPPSAPVPPTPPPSLMSTPPPPAQPSDQSASARSGSDGPDRQGRFRFRPPPQPGPGNGPPNDRGSSPRGPEPPPSAPIGPMPPGTDESDRIRIDVGPIAQDVFRQFVPEGTNPRDLTPEMRQRVASEINQRMLGINEGIKLAAAELKRKADQAREKAVAEAKAASTRAPAKTKRRAALSGSRLDVSVEENGKVVRTANAEVNLPNMLMTVFSSMPHGRGEVPFAVGKDGRVYTPTPANRATVEQLAPAKLGNGASMVGEWVVVVTPDPTGSGLRLGIARPVGDSMTELRRTAGRNAGLGLAFIGLSIVLIVPLSGRLTRNLSRLTDAVTRIAHGEYSTRVPVKSKDEIGELAVAFNQMASDVEEHQHAVVGQERLKRELELGRQIQHDMQPQKPLRLGLTEIQGVSVPAREVGGDFFNYFTLPGGADHQIALLVGDVSGKGVGAALLMANIQASLRTRFALGQDLSAIVDAIDRDIQDNSPGQMYATLFVGILDPSTRLLRYVNAGHHPQYVLRRTGGLERMGSTGLPAGLLAGRGYIEKHVQLDENDLMFFYTDGCPETENAQEEFFGSARLEALLVASGTVGPDDVLQRVEGALTTFRGTREPFDDATMMAVRVG